MKVSISLTEKHLKFIDDRVAAGLYESRSAAVASGIRRLVEDSLIPEYIAMFAEYTEEDYEWAAFPNATAEDE